MLSSELKDFEAAFKRVYMAEFGFLLQTKGIIVDDIKARTELYTSFPS